MVNLVRISVCYLGNLLSFLDLRGVARFEFFDTDDFFGEFGSAFIEFFPDIHHFHAQSLIELNYVQSVLFQFVIFLEIAINFEIRRGIVQSVQLFVVSDPIYVGFTVELRESVDILVVDTVQELSTLLLLWIR